MNFIYSTNIWSHHQSLVAMEFEKLLGFDHFKMMLFKEVPAERRKQGWNVLESLPPWVIGPPRTPAEMQTLVQECRTADVMILGAAPQKIMEARIATGKLTFVALERMLKKPLHRLRMLNPRYAIGMRRYQRLVTHEHVHALAIGHYASDDLRKIGAFADRIWRWGYFIETPSSLEKPAPKRPLKILWAGRMLDGKRVDLLLKAVGTLVNSGCIGECLIVGDGPERKRLLTLAHKLHLDTDCVRFLPSVSHTEVRGLMRESDVYVLPSNRHEGWGAVAGEAMAEGCVLVANEQAGAARELVQDGVTGLLFRDDDVAQLAGHLQRLAADYPLRMRLREQAWKQMQDVWHPRVAAERLISFSNGLLGRCEIPVFNNGPCAKV
ncbi:MAG: glycosyltransferase [Candidatus Electrothrix sp. AR3]|nr:glycosyltransferase [Candidatus Electrothrix sp. AR3]